MTPCPRCSSDQFFHVLLIEEISQFSINADGEIEDEDSEVSDLLEDSFRCSHCGYTTSCIEDENDTKALKVPQKIRVRLETHGGL